MLYLPYERWPLHSVVLGKEVSPRTKYVAGGPSTYPEEMDSEVLLAGLLPQRASVLDRLSDTVTSGST